MSEIVIPNMHAWRWRAQVMSQDMRPEPQLKRHPLHLDVGYFFDNLRDVHEAHSVINNEAVASWPSTDKTGRKKSLVEALQMIHLKYNEDAPRYPDLESVTITDVEALKDYITATPFGVLVNHFSKGNFRGFRGRYVNTPEFEEVFTDVLDATADGSIYEIGRDIQRQNKPIEVDTTGIQSLAGFAQKASEASAYEERQLAAAYSAYIKSGSLAAIVETVGLFETIGVIDDALHTAN